jgi:anti-sigma B factor antagonist
MPHFGLTVTPHETYCVITLVGDVDRLSVPNLADALVELRGAGHVRLIIDVSELQFCDSGGLWALIRNHREAEKRGGYVRLIGVQGILARLLDITRLIKLFPAYPSVEEALNVGPAAPLAGTNASTAI